jgi:hypothetical protein
MIQKAHDEDAEYAVVDSPGTAVKAVITLLKAVAGINSIWSSTSNSINLHVCVVFCDRCKGRRHDGEWLHIDVV